MSKSKNQVPEYSAAPPPQQPNLPNYIDVGNINSMPSSGVPNSQTRVNDVITSESIWDPGANTFNYRVYDNPMEHRALNNQRELLTDATTKIGNMIKTYGDPAQREQDVQDIYNPVKREVEDTYNRALGQNINMNNALGTLNSVAFQDYAQNQNRKNLANSLADAMSSARIQSLQIPGIKLAPLIDATATAQSGIDAAQNRNLAILDPSFRGQSLGASNLAQNFMDRLNALRTQNDIATQQFTNQSNLANEVNQYNLQNANTMNAYNLNAYNSKQANKGFFSRLF